MNAKDMARTVFRVLSLAMMAFVLVVASAQPAGLALALGGTRLYLDPTPLTINAIGNTGTTDVKVENVSNLAGVEFHIKFDPAVAEVVSVKAGPFFTGNTVPMPLVPVFDNASGTIDFVGAVVSPTQPYTGTGVTVANITWRLKACSTTSLEFPSTKLSKLSDPSSGAISHTRTNGSIKGCQAPVTGKVLLQGRTDHSGTTVYWTEEACPTVQAVSVKGLPNVVSAPTDPQGNFTITPLPGHSYQCLLATHDMYLVARKTLTTGGPQPTVTLPGGNVVSDKCVNIFDLARIANAVGSHDPISDVNGDGTVDIYDLTITAGNFGVCGPIDWP